MFQTGFILNRRDDWLFFLGDLLAARRVAPERLVDPGEAAAHDVKPDADHAQAHLDHLPRDQLLLVLLEHHLDLVAELANELLHPLAVMRKLPVQLLDARSSAQAREKIR